MEEKNETKYELGATEKQIERLHDALKIGLSLKDALSYAPIDIFIFGEWILNYRLLKYIKANNKVRNKCNKQDILNIISEMKLDEGELDETADNECAYPEQLERFRTDSAYKSHIYKTAQIIEEIKKDRIQLEGKLLKDLHKAPEVKNRGWLASSWLLERLFPQKYDRDFIQKIENAEDGQTVKNIAVEYIDSSTGDERVKSLEAELVKELKNDESKA